MGNDIKPVFMAGASFWERSAVRHVDAGPMHSGVQGVYPGYTGVYTEGVHG